MSRFDQLTLELINRPSISENERLGLAELQLQRAQRMHWLMIGDNSENSDVIKDLASIRNDSLETLQKKRESERASKQQEAEAKQLTEILIRQQQQQNESQQKQESDVLIQENEKPSKKDIASHSNTPSAASPFEKLNSNNRAGVVAETPAAEGGI